jgi:hypothetical protein
MGSVTNLSMGKGVVNMKYLKIILGLVMVAGLMAVVASPAMALTPRWVTCVANAGAGHFTENKCITAGANGGWETAEIAKTVEVTSSGTLELEDSAATGGKVNIECTGTNLGTVGAEGGGGITKITATNCEFIKKEHGSCEEGQTRTAEPVNLPWSANLEEVNSELRVLIRSLTTKPPGWKVTCRVGGILKISDECTGGSSTSVRSNRVTGATETEFEKITNEREPASCTQGNSTSGHVHGTFIGKLRNSKGELQPLWVLASILHT